MCIRDRYEDGTRKELGEIEELKGIQENARALVVQTDCLLKQEDRKEIEQQIENKTHIPTSVSYTHLDVYKRQVLR